MPLVATTVPSPALVSPKPSPWGKANTKSPWGTNPTAAHIPSPAVSLMDVMKSDQQQSDYDLCQKLELGDQEPWICGRCTLENAATLNQCEVCGADVSEKIVASTEPEVEHIPTPASTSTSTSTTIIHDGDEVVVIPPDVPETCTSDADIARLLQAEFDEAYNDEVSIAENKANRMVGNGKVQMSFDLYRSYPSSRALQQQQDPTEGESDEEEDVQDVLTYDKAHKVFRDGRGTIVTKHNAESSLNAHGLKLMSDLPSSFRSGDTRKRGDKIRVSSKVYNKLHAFAFKNEKGSRRRLKEGKDTSTSDLALDTKTRLILFRMINAQILNEVNGAISTGKEAIVFQGIRHENPDNLESALEGVAIKVFKTTITEFKQRQQFLHGDRRYETRVGKLSARKLVKLWAEKEAANLHRLQKFGVNCPKVVLQHKHVLVMSFIGDHETGVPAPKLKEAKLSQRGLVDCMEQVRATMHTMYNKCSLVHADLSEYNLLVHKKQIVVIDVGQSVIPTHPRADEFLYRDCVNVCRFFGTVKHVPGCPTPEDLFFQVCGREITSENASQYKHVINVCKQAPKRSERYAQDSSSICLSYDMSRELAELPTLPRDDDDDDDEDDDDDVDDDNDVDGDVDDDGDDIDNDEEEEEKKKKPEEDKENGGVVVVNDGVMNDGVDNDCEDGDVVDSEDDGVVVVDVVDGVVVVDGVAVDGDDAVTLMKVIADAKNNNDDNNTDAAATTTTTTHPMPPPATTTPPLLSTAAATTTTTETVTEIEPDRL